MLAVVGVPAAVSEDDGLHEGGGATDVVGVVKAEAGVVFRMQRCRIASSGGAKNTMTTIAIWKKR